MSAAVAATEGATFKVGDETLTVGPKCELNMGVWYCTTHGEAFQNNLMKDGHVGDIPGEHVLAWGCLSHGPEVP